MKFLLALALLTASTSCPASSKDERLLQAASRNIDEAEACWGDDDMECFAVNMRSAILKLDSTEQVDTVRYVMSRLSQDQIWYLIMIFRGKKA